MSRAVRRSNSEETSRRPAGNRNILSVNSDGDVSNKRNSWWKNLSGNLRRNSSQFHPESHKVLNASSSEEEVEQNSQWWKNLSVNTQVSLPIKLKSIAEKGNRSSNNLLEKNLSQDESENENVSKNIFPKKSIFTSQEQPSQKSRYSRAFNLNTERQIEQDSQKQTNTEIEEVINELEENKITQSPTSKLIKANKKKRRTKSIFSKRPIKRTYDDVFPEPKEVQDKETIKNQLILQDDSKDDTAEKLEKKEKLFKLNLKKKKYSEEFFDEPVANNNNTQVEDCSKVEGKALSKSKLSQNSELDEEINIEEIQTQKDASYSSNRSVNVTRGRKSSLHKTLEKTPSKQIQNEIKIVTSDKRNLRSTTPKRKESVVQPTKTLIDSESSDNEIYIEEVISQQVSAETKNRKSLRPTGNKILQGNIETRDVENEEVDETKLYPSQKSKKSQILHTETEKEESFDEKLFIAQTTAQTNLSQRNTRNKQYSETFLGSRSEKGIDPNDEKSFEVTRTQKGLFQRNTRTKKYSEAFLSSSTNQTLQNDNNKSQSEREISEHVEQSIESPRTKKGLFERITRSKKYSEAFLGSSKNNTLQDDNGKSQREQEIDGPAEKSIELPRIQKGLLQRNSRSKQYSEGFLGPSTSKTLQDNAKSQSENEINEQTKTQKDSFQKNTRSKQYSEGFMSSSTSKTLHNNEKSQSENEINVPDEHSLEQTRTQKDAFQRNTRSKQYSEGFLSSSTSKALQNNKESQSEKEIDEPNEKPLEQTGKQKDSFQRNTRSKQYSEGFLSSSTSKTLQNNEESQSEKKIDEPDEKSLEQARTHKDSFQRNTRNKQYSEGFLRSSTSKSLQNNEDSQSEKEIDEPDEKSLEQTRKQKDLFQRNTRNKQYSEAFLYPSTSKPLHSSDDKSQSEKEGIVNLQASDENNKINRVSSQEMFSRQRESLDQIVSKNTKCSQAFLELLAMQKPIDEEHNTPVIKNVEHNKPDKEIVEKESVNDTQYSSISSIDVSDKIKHPLFRPQARRSLYSAKPIGNVNEETEKQSTHEPQQQDVENSKSKKIKTKRISFRSTSPAESGISKFFDESLISSTKYFINSNEGTGSEESAKKKTKTSKKLSSEENNEKDNKHTPRRHTPSRKDRNSKLLSTVSEQPDNSLINENCLTKNKMIKDNKDVQSEDEINDKNSALQKGNNSKLLLKSPEHSDNVNQIVEENQETHSEDQTKIKNSISKKGKKFKSIISTTEVHREDGNENFVLTSTQKSKSVTKSSENKMNEENKCSTEHSDSNKNQIGFSRSRRSNSVTRDSENSAQNKTGNEPTTDNTDVKHNTKLKKKRKRTTKSTTKIHENPQNIIPSEQEITKDEKNINDTEKSAENDKVVADRKRKLSVKTSENVDLILTGNEVEEDDNYKNMESEKSRISKKSSIHRIRKSSLRTDRNTNIFSDEKDVETEDILKSFLVSERVGISVENLPEHKKIMEVHENRKDKKINAQISRKSVFNVSNTYNQISSEEEPDAVFIKKSLESIKSRKIKSNSQTSLANKISENIQEKSLQIETPMQLSFDSNNHKKLSSKSSIDRISDSQAISGIITINSSISRVRSSQTNQNTENWLSKSNITNNTRFKENHTKNSRESNIDPVPKIRKIIKDKCLPLYNEKEDLERHKLFVNAANIIGSKPKKSPPRATDKKITDFFSKLGKDEELKPIPKKVKKTLRPVCTARLIDGKPYYKKKLFKGERWCSEKFYKHIQNKIRKQYGDDTINESENLMRYIVSSVKAVIKSKKYVKKEVDDLKKELARYGIISTTYDFFCFCFEYLPAEYRDLAIPRTQCGPTVPYNEEDTFKKIDF